MSKEATKKKREGRLENFAIDDTVMILVKDVRRPDVATRIHGFLTKQAALDHAKVQGIDITEDRAHEPGKKADVKLESLTKDVLADKVRELAATKGVEASANGKKAELIATILELQELPDAEAGGEGVDDKDSEDGDD